MRRTCLHCVIIRALRVESPALRSAGLDARIGLSEPILLPASASALFRRLRGLLRTAVAEAHPGPVKVTIVDLVGKADVEVTVAFTAARGWRVLSCSFPRHDPRLLPLGFAEQLTGVDA